MKIQNTNFKDLDTPALLIEKSILEDNIKHMQELANKYGKKLRPHIKTHKMPEIAKMQLEAGAVGIACAKISEAEIMAKHGFKDIQIANIIVSEKKIKRMLELSQKLDRLTCCVDSIEGARQIASIFNEEGKEMEVFIKVDVGFHRVGIEDYDKLLKLAKTIELLDGIFLAGLVTHAGQVYEVDSVEKIKEASENGVKIVSEFRNRLKEDGIDIKEISLGSTPGSEYLLPCEGFEELRAGNFIFRDMIQVMLGTSEIDQCASSILATIVSKPSENQAVCDAGAKSLNLDMGAHGRTDMSDSHGYIIAKNAKIKRLSEEHAVILHDGENFEIAEQIRIIPNHACTVSNLHNKAYLVDGDKIIKEIEISARGCNW